MNTIPKTFTELQLNDLYVFDDDDNRLTYMALVTLKSANSFEFQSIGVFSGGEGWFGTPDQPLETKLVAKVDSDKFTIYTDSLPNELTEAAAQAGQKAQERYKLVSKPALAPESTQPMDVDNNDNDSESDGMNDAHMKSRVKKEITYNVSAMNLDNHETNDDDDDDDDAIVLDGTNTSKIDAFYQAELTKTNNIGIAQKFRERISVFLSNKKTDVYKRRIDYLYEQDLGNVVPMVTGTAVSYMEKLAPADRIWGSFVRDPQQNDNTLAGPNTNIKPLLALTKTDEELMASGTAARQANVPRNYPLSFSSFYLPAKANTVENTFMKPMFTPMGYKNEPVSSPLYVIPTIARAVIFDDMIHFRDQTREQATIEKDATFVNVKTPNFETDSTRPNASFNLEFEEWPMDITETFKKPNTICLIKLNKDYNEFLRLNDKTTSIRQRVMLSQVENMRMSIIEYVLRRGVNKRDASDMNYELIEPHKMETNEMDELSTALKEEINPLNPPTSLVQYVDYLSHLGIRLEHITSHEEMIIYEQLKQIYETEQQQIQKHHNQAKEIYSVHKRQKIIAPSMAVYNAVQFIKAYSNSNELLNQIDDNRLLIDLRQRIMFIENKPMSFTLMQLLFRLYSHALHLSSSSLSEAWNLVDKQNAISNATVSASQFQNMDILVHSYPNKIEMEKDDVRVWGKENLAEYTKEFQTYKPFLKDNDEVTNVVNGMSQAIKNKLPTNMLVDIISSLNVSQRTIKPYPSKEGPHELVLAGDEYFHRTNIGWDKVEAVDFNTYNTFQRIVENQKTQQFQALQGGTAHATKALIKALVDQIAFEFDANIVKFHPEITIYDEDQENSTKVTSPFVQEMEMTLMIPDTTKKWKKFMNKHTKWFQTGPNDWLLCKQTGIRLLPYVFFKLAEAYSTQNFKEYENILVTNNGIENRENEGFFCKQTFRKIANPLNNTIRDDEVEQLNIVMHSANDFQKIAFQYFQQNKFPNVDVEQTINQLQTFDLKQLSKINDNVKIQIPALRKSSKLANFKFDESNLLEYLEHKAEVEYADLKLTLQSIEILIFELMFVISLNPEQKFIAKYMENKVGAPSAPPYDEITKTKMDTVNFYVLALKKLLKNDPLSFGIMIINRPTSFKQYCSFETKPSNQVGVVSDNPTIETRALQVIQNINTVVRNSNLTGENHCLPEREASTMLTLFSAKVPDAEMFGAHLTMTDNRVTKISPTTLLIGTVTSDKEQPRTSSSFVVHTQTNVKRLKKPTNTIDNDELIQFTFRNLDSSNANPDDILDAVEDACNQCNLTTVTRNVFNDCQILNDLSSNAVPLNREMIHIIYETIIPMVMCSADTHTITHIDYGNKFQNSVSGNALSTKMKKDEQIKITGSFWNCFRDGDDTIKIFADQNKIKPKLQTAIQMFKYAKQRSLDKLCKLVLRYMLLHIIKLMESDGSPRVLFEFLKTSYMFAHYSKEELDRDWENDTLSERHRVVTELGKLTKEEKQFVRISTKGKQKKTFRTNLTEDQTNIAQIDADVAGLDATAPAAAPGNAVAFDTTILPKDEAEENML